FPSVWSVYQYGANGSFYLFPIPSQQLSTDMDAYCSVIPLVDDNTVDAIPYPWTDAVPYYAAYLAYDNAQRKDDSARMLTDYENMMGRCRKFAEPIMIPDPYDADYY